MKKKIIKFLIVSILWMPSLFGKEPVIHQIVVDPGPTVSAETVRQVLPFKEGDLFDQGRLDQALTYLKQWGRFETVNVEKKVEKEGVVLIFHLQAGLVISRIHLKGHYPFLTRRIMTVINLHVGEIYHPETVQEQTGRIVRFFEGQGYAGTQVFVEEKKGKKGHLQLLFRIKKGRRYRINRIFVEGNTYFPDGYFVSQINPLIPYQPPRVKEAMEKMRHDYQQNSFYKAHAKLVKTEFDTERGKVDLWIRVDQHDRVAVRFQGNRRLSDRTLRKSLTFEQEGDYDRYEVEQSRRSLLSFYRRQGFLETEIEPIRQTPRPGETVLIFRINEGPRTQVHSIRFRGNEQLSPGALKKKMETREAGFFHWAPFNPDSYKKDLDRLPEVYQDRGYLKAKVTADELGWSRDKERVFVSLSIAEGEKSLVQEVLFEGNRFFTEKKLLKKTTLRVGKVFQRRRLEEDREKISVLYTDNGFPYATVQAVPVVHEETGRVSIHYKIDEGVPVTVGKILVLGNQLTREKTIRKILSLKEGDPFSQSQVLESAANLRRVGAYNTVNIEVIGLVEKESVVHLLVKLEESKTLVADLATSFDTYERFSGELTLTHRNLFGLAKQGNFRFKGGEKLQRGEFNLIDPHFAGYNLQVIGTGFSQYENKPAFDAFESGGILSVLKEFDPEISLLGRYEFKRSYITDKDPADNETKRDNTTSKVGFSFTYDTRDYFADPTRGLFLMNSADVAATMLGGGSSFLKLRGWFGHYKTFAGRLTFANSFRMEGIRNLGSEAVPIQELLFAGGDYTLRGFSQDAAGPVAADGTPEGGRILLLHNFEIQTKLVKNVKAVVFLDSGSLTNRFAEIDLSSLRHSAGLGLRYVTPVGPLRFDYGFKLDKRDGEGRGHFHFSFGYPF